MAYLIYLAITLSCCLIVAYENPSIKQAIHQSAIKTHAHHVSNAKPMLESLSFIQFLLSAWMIMCSMHIPKSKEQILFFMFENGVYLITMCFAVFNSNKIIYSILGYTAKKQKEKNHVKNMVDRIVLWMPPRLTLMTLLVVALNALNAFLCLF